METKVKMRNYTVYARIAAGKVGTRNHYGALIVQDTPATVLPPFVVRAVDVETAENMAHTIIGNRAGVATLDIRAPRA